MPAAHTGKFVAYYRVSTPRQGRSGLGLEAQQTAVRDYLDGGDWRLVAELTEVESGKRSDRPKLAEALKLCRLHGATLIIAKLDRLARNVAFVSNLMEAGVKVARRRLPSGEPPHDPHPGGRRRARSAGDKRAHEGRACERQEARREARWLSRHDGHRGDAQGGLGGCAERTKARAADLAPIIAELQAAGATSLRAIAAGLNARGIPTARGTGTWSAVQVARVLEWIGPFVQAAA